MSASDKLKTLLSNSAKLQTLAGVSGDAVPATSALAYIKIGEYDAEEFGQAAEGDETAQFTRPLVVVGLPKNQVTDSRTLYFPRGRLEVVIELDPTAQERGNRGSFLDRVYGDVTTILCEAVAAGVGTLLATSNTLLIGATTINELTIVHPEDAPQQGIYCVAHCSVDFGIGS